jgi:cytochrome P450
MTEILAAKKAAIQSSSIETGDSPTVDLISQLLKAQTERETTTEKGDDQGSKQAPSLADSEVLGNLFMFIIAGHETSANSIHFCLLLLALHPTAQRKVQSVLSEIFQSRIDKPATWDYERDFPRLLNSYLAAVLNEELRLVAPTITIPKTVPTPGKWQDLRIDIGTEGAGTGRVVQVPPGCMVRLCLPSVHRNPRFWPHGPAAGEGVFATPDHNGGGTDLEEFQPERWVVPGSGDDDVVTINTEAETETEIDTDIEMPSLTPAKGLYAPPRGAFIPFSDGQRACLGRRFAQVEILAALAAILSSHSVELDMGEFLVPSGDDQQETQVDEMSLHQKKALWCRARDAAREKLRTRMIAIITLQLRGASVPLRIVPRGREWFGDGVVGEEEERG